MLIHVHSFSICLGVYNDKGSKKPEVQSVLRDESEKYPGSLSSFYGTLRSREW